MSLPFSHRSLNSLYNLPLFVHYTLSFFCTFPPSPLPSYSTSFIPFPVRSILSLRFPFSLISPPSSPFFSAFSSLFSPLSLLFLSSLFPNFLTNPLPPFSLQSHSFYPRSTLLVIFSYFSPHFLSILFQPSPFSRSFLCSLPIVSPSSNSPLISRRIFSILSREFRSYFPSCFLTTAFPFLPILLPLSPYSLPLLLHVLTFSSYLLFSHEFSGFPSQFSAGLLSNVTPDPFLLLSLLFLHSLYIFSPTPPISFRLNTSYKISPFSLIIPSPFSNNDSSLTALALSFLSLSVPRSEAV